MTDRRRVSFAQNAEDVRVWRAFRDADPTTLRYVDVGANEHRHLSITASLHDEGWRGVLIEADPVLAEELRVHRPDDLVIEVAAAGGEGELVFHRVPGTGLGTLDADEAAAAAARGFAVETVTVRTRALDDVLDEVGLGEGDRDARGRGQSQERRGLGPAGPAAARGLGAVSRPSPTSDRARHTAAASGRAVGPENCARTSPIMASRSPSTSRSTGASAFAVFSFIASPVPARSRRAGSRWSRRAA